MGDFPLMGAGEAGRAERDPCRAGQAGIAGNRVRLSSGPGGRWGGGTGREPGIVSHCSYLCSALPTGPRATPDLTQGTPLASSTEEEDWPSGSAEPRTCQGTLFYEHASVIHTLSSSVSLKFVSGCGAQSTLDSPICCPYPGSTLNPNPL